MPLVDDITRIDGVSRRLTRLRAVYRVGECLTLRHHRPVIRRLRLLRPPGTLTILAPHACVGLRPAVASRGRVPSRPRLILLRLGLL